MKWTNKDETKYDLQNKKYANMSLSFVDKDEKKSLVAR